MCVCVCVVSEPLRAGFFFFWNCRHPDELSSRNPDSSFYVVLTSDTPRGVRVTVVKLVHTDGTTAEGWGRGLAHFYLIHTQPEIKNKTNSLDC